ncbi:hypothetical protein MLD38_033295 [Melastoma candidum]|uniref:Uncharacterized protein n=2 Tax=Melastoma candidum TaxID=119954 RepID=A0ACB9M8J6_9MYRT|nr:hypothetical protein MLD38_033295 [Melastoma candidum]
MHFIRLDYDGHLRAYGHTEIGLFFAKGDDVLGLKTCEYPMACGPYGICSNGQCTCPPPRGQMFDFYQVSFGQRGCYRKVPLTCEGSHKQVFLRMAGISCFNLATDLMSIEENRCIEVCAKNCSCKAAFFMSGQGNYERGCLLVTELFWLHKVDEASLIDHCTVYLKVQNQSSELDSDVVIPGEKGEENFLQKAKRAGLGVAIFFAFLSLVVAWFLLWQRTHLNKEMEDDHFEEVPGMPTRFSYMDLKSITNDFSWKLGEGGFGAVFEGALQDGTKVAVKRLDGFRHMKKSFLNEVRTIGSVHHINLVVLLGFCAERSHRLLVYEYMSNGSLDGWIFSESSRPALDWPHKMDVIMDVAKGLHYLHEDCNKKIVHLDIKPQNILLDNNIRGKISDFGLSRLVDSNKGQIQTTTVKGSPGYLAPEWLNGQVTEKADVYSFGVVVLEVILGRKVVGDHWDSDMWKELEKKAKEGTLMNLSEGDSKDLKPDENVIAHVSRAIRVAAWCLQKDFQKRPSMSVVIKVLDGIMGIEDELVYDFTSHPMSTKSRCEETVLWPSILSGPR